MIATQRGGIELQRSARSDGVFIGGGIQPQASAKYDGFAQFMLLEGDVGVVQRGHRFLRFEQQRDYMVRIFGIESSGSGGKTIADWRAARDAVPGKVDPVKNIFRRHGA